MKEKELALAQRLFQLSGWAKVKECWKKEGYDYELKALIFPIFLFSSIFSFIRARARRKINENMMEESKKWKEKALDS